MGTRVVRARVMRTRVRETRMMCRDRNSVSY